MDEVKLCECGCGSPAPIAKRTTTSKGHVKGEPVRFIMGHNTRTDPVVRFWRYVTKHDGSCWLWSGALTNGYGTMNINQKTVPAHRFSYELHKGKIPEGLQIDHLCRVHNCVNPDHLEAVTSQINMLRGKSPTILLHLSGKCKHGHEMTPDNTYYVSRYKGGNKKAICKACSIRRSVECQRKRRARRKESNND